MAFVCCSMPCVLCCAALLGARSMRLPPVLVKGTFRASLIQFVAVGSVPMAKLWCSRVLFGKQHSSHWFDAPITF